MVKDGGVIAGAELDGCAKKCAKGMFFLPSHRALPLQSPRHLPSFPHHLPSYLAALASLVRTTDPLGERQHTEPCSAHVYV